MDKRLGELGIGSHLTRSKDINLERITRTDKVSNYKYCLSHHFNAGGGTGAEFIHSIYADGEFEKILKEKFEDRGYPVRRIFDKTYPGNTSKDYYYMHRDTGKARTTIIEYDFLDGNNHDKLKDFNYRKGMYEAVIEAVCERHGVKYVAPKSKNDDGDVFYRVVTESFKNRENAENYVKQLEAKGVRSFIDVYKK